MLVRVETGEKSGAGGAARIGLAIVPREARGLPRQRIEMRRAGKRKTRRSQQIAAPLVGGDEQDVRARGVERFVAHLYFSVTVCLRRLACQIVLNSVPEARFSIAKSSSIPSTLTNRKRVALRGAMTEFLARTK